MHQSIFPLRLPFMAGILTLACAGPVLAQAEACVDPNTRQVDQHATDTWLQMSQRADPGLMGQMAGTWYIEIRNQLNAQIDQQYQRFSADGFFDYHSHVCDTSTGGCNDYSGKGNYAVMAMGDGSMQFMTIVSDLNRDRQCSGSAARFVDANTLQLSTGELMKRTQ
jgi:hypothetical protein